MRLLAMNKSEFSVLQENPTLFPQKTSSKLRSVQRNESRV